VVLAGFGEVEGALVMSEAGWSVWRVIVRGKDATHYISKTNKFFYGRPEEDYV
jgi:hypothetical protein